MEIGELFTEEKQEYCKKLLVFTLYYLKIKREMINLSFLFVIEKPLCYNSRSKINYQR